jgi:hypothetical protein
MKGLALVPVLAAAVIACSEGSVVGGAEGPSAEGSRQEPGRTKDECLLVAVRCGDSFDTLQQRIDRLQNEISKGRSVYTPDELKILRKKLDNARKTMEFFKYEGAVNLYKYPGE